MFGVLNRFIGGLDTEPVQHPRTPTDNAFGFQVLRNKDPELPLEPWFDFIVGINGHPIVRIMSLILATELTSWLQEDPDPNLFATEVRNCAGTSVTFEIWSAKVRIASRLDLSIVLTDSGPKNTHRVRTSTSVESHTRSRLTTSPPFLDTTYLARAVHSIPAEPSLPRRTPAALRLHYRNAQRDITRRCCVGRVGGRPSEPDTRTLGIQQRIRRGTRGGAGPDQGLGRRRCPRRRTRLRGVAPVTCRARRGGRGAGRGRLRDEGGWHLCADDTGACSHGC
jgi:hypothetical protein